MPPAPAVRAPRNHKIPPVFSSHSHSDSDAREAAAITSQFVCPFSKQLVADSQEDAGGFD